jgi:hypothetical protein
MSDQFGFAEAGLVFPALGGGAEPDGESCQSKPTCSVRCVDCWTASCKEPSVCSSCQQCCSSSNPN